MSVRKPLQYATSFFGIIDLVAVLPTYLALIFPELQALIDVRVLRLLRVFRIFKLVAYVAEYQFLGRALVASGQDTGVSVGGITDYYIPVGAASPLGRVATETRAVGLQPSAQAHTAAGASGLPNGIRRGLRLRSWGAHGAPRRHYRHRLRLLASGHMTTHDEMPGSP